MRGSTQVLHLRTSLQSAAAGTHPKHALEYTTVVHHPKHARYRFTCLCRKHGQTLRMQYQSPQTKTHEQTFVNGILGGRPYSPCNACLSKEPICQTHALSARCRILQSPQPNPFTRSLCTPPALSFCSTSNLMTSDAILPLLFAGPTLCTHRLPFCLQFTTSTSPNYHPYCLCKHQIYEIKVCVVKPFGTKIQGIVITHPQN